MDSPLVPGQLGESLPSGEHVLRLVNLSLEGKVQDTSFELTSTDKRSYLQALSVWCERLTSPQQAELLMEVVGKYSHATYLEVDAIRKLRPKHPRDPDPGPEKAPSLDVVWEPLEIANSDGHAGIRGLMKPPGLDKLFYLSFRSQLADIANKRIVGLRSQGSEEGN